MSLQINGLDGNLFGFRDEDGSGMNFITTYHVITPSGSYVTGGDTLDITQVSALIPSSSAPVLAEVTGQGNTAGTSWTALGNYFAVVQGATLATWKLQAWSGGGAQQGAGAYPSTITNDRIVLRLVWRKLL